MLTDKPDNFQPVSDDTGLRIPYARYQNNEQVYHRVQYCIKGKVYEELMLAGAANNTLFNTMGESVEDFIQNNKKQWDSYNVASPFEIDYIPTEKYTRIQTTQPIKHSPHVTVYNTKTLLKEHGLKLNTHATCVCEETGIAYAVELPCPIESVLTVIHPLAYFHNCHEIIRKYQRHGIPLSGLEPTVLAGILITVLKHKGWTSCKDNIAANKRLSTVNKRTLTYAIWYFYKAEARYHRPQLNLLDSGNPTTQLIQFLRICNDEDESVQVLHMQEKNKVKIRAKLHTNIVDKEHAQLKEDVRGCKRILEKLHKAVPTVSNTMIESLDNRVRRLALLSDEQKKKLSDDIFEIFGDRDECKAIGLIIRSSSTDSIQKDLITFSMELEQDISDWQANKADMIAKLKGIKKG